MNQTKKLKKKTEIKQMLKKLYFGLGFYELNSF